MGSLSRFTLVTRAACTLVNAAPWLRLPNTGVFPRPSRGRRERAERDRPGDQYRRSIAFARRVGRAGRRLALVLHRALWADRIQLSDGESSACNLHRSGHGLRPQRHRFAAVDHRHRSDRSRSGECRPLHGPGVVLADAAFASGTSVQYGRRTLALSSVVQRRNAADVQDLVDPALST